MNTDFADWAVRKTVKVYLAYQHAIHAQAQKGRPYLLPALYAVLVHEGLNGKIAAGTPDPPDSGHLIVEDRLNIHIACVPRPTLGVPPASPFEGWD